MVEKNFYVYSICSCRHVEILLFSEAVSAGQGSKRLLSILRVSLVRTAPSLRRVTQSQKDYGILPVEAARITERSGEGADEHYGDSEA